MWKTIEPPEGGHILIGVNQSFLRGESVKMTLIERVWADGFRESDFYYGVRTGLPTRMINGNYTLCGTEYKNAIRMRVDGPVEARITPE